MTGEGGGELSVAEQRDCFRRWLGREAGPGPVRVVETHVSILGLGPDRVWKLKKAVRFPFIDLSTAALRRRNCEREVALNRRFAPDVYLGVRPLVDEDGAEVDALVEMVRMPDDRRLAVVAGTASARGCVDAIADALVQVHRRATTDAEIDRAGSPEALSALWTESVAELRPFAGAVLDSEVLASVADDARRYLASRGPLFAQRIAGRHIRDGHGDLLADDVFCLDDGPRFLDCLEFDDGLRYGDVLADVAFLAMDLERLGHPDLAARLLGRYRDLAHESWPESLANFYVAYRAVVRSKVACLRIGTGDAAATAAASDAVQLLSLAARHLARGRVRLVLVGGPPATGKTTLARELEARTGWFALHSDEVRKRLAGLDPTTPAAGALDTGLYTPEWSRRTYAALFERARELLEGGESVILDASWSDPRFRADAARVATSTAAVLGEVVLTAPGEIADARARARAAAGRDASDASDAVSGTLRARFAPWPGATTLDATQPAAELAPIVLRALGYPPEGRAP